MSGPRDEADDFRHRMLRATSRPSPSPCALTAIGIWLAMSIADLRKTQDCVLMGRRDCAQISVAAVELAVSGREPFFGPRIAPTGTGPSSIELRAPLRYTGTRLRPRE